MEQVATEGSPAATRRRPAHLWLVAMLALLWNGFGVFDFFATNLRLDFYVAQLTAEQLAYFDAFPLWMTVVWALGVGGAFLGSVALVLARSWAVPMFGLSIGALAVSSLYNFVLAEGLEVMGTAMVVMSIVIWIVVIALFLYALAQRRRGVLA
jgi:hypothetical protein